MKTNLARGLLTANRILSAGNICCSSCLCGLAGHLRDLKIHIASVQQVLVDPKLADPQKRASAKTPRGTLLSPTL